jgi:hypothetical protein
MKHVSSMRTIGVGFAALSFVLGMAASASAAPNGVPGPNPDAPGQIKKDNPPIVVLRMGSMYAALSRSIWRCSA